ncbi:hypothetical protein PTKIN_Ptkin03bG0235000 [Pterospermum kingtungense]
METPPPPFSSKESRINRFKPIWRILLISNLALGAYMFAKARKKNSGIVNIKHSETGAEHDKSETEAEHDNNETEADFASDPVTTALIHEEPPILPVVARPPMVLEPIPEDRQRELFEWMLEEKRKVKPTDPEERKRIDEEKAVLKQFIRAKSLPRI